MNLSLYKHIYLIGIGGIGMSALARYFNLKGKHVFGYDKVRSDLCLQLENEGINIHYEDVISDIPGTIKKAKHDDVLIIYTPAISNENKIFLFFQNQGAKILKRAQVLGMISKQMFTIAVAGTHGKTTTSTMLAHILKKSGKEITAFLGGISRNYNTNLLFSDKGNILIVEADEYDKSFLEIYPDIAIITSVDADHLDVYQNKNSLDIAFQQFASQIKPKGFLLVEKSIELDFAIPAGGRMSNYSVNICSDYYTQNIRVQNSTMFFDIIISDFFLGSNSKKHQKDIKLSMPGLHNISNAVAASAVACYLGVSNNDIVDGLASFIGINRRFDKHIDTAELVYIDDYAHHPEEIGATIDATKQLYPFRELIVVFQPHLFTRTRDFASDFALSLQAADDLVLLDIYPAREKPITGITSQIILDLCNNPKKELCSKKELLSILENKNIDVLLTLGAGDIASLVQPIKHMLN
ncbi:MAG: UDP-N-acetylmuramate--L-alanine ligase [Bacteroidota bacterium]|nr:UDP-N-acetylmuramate--L-alanine ligase [Bacteroidota bacterium]